MLNSNFVAMQELSVAEVENVSGGSCADNWWAMNRPMCAKQGISRSDLERAM
jgi:hypothetical protein